MANLPEHVIDSRREVIQETILDYWELNNDKEWYYLQCPCRPNCDHFNAEEIPRIILPYCFYPGELDYFMALQPYYELHNFRIAWICIHEGCENEFACGFPPLSDFEDIESSDTDSN